MTMLTIEQIPAVVRQTIAKQSVIDLHTHLYAPAFGTPDVGADSKVDPTGLLLWGIDELVTYHYLVAEVYRVVPASKLPYEQFWRMSRQQQADHIWKHLFVERAPISEACRGVLTTLQSLGLDPNEKSLEPYRKWFSAQNPSKHIDRVMQLAGVESITMTNPVFDDNERGKWEADPSVGRDPRFKAVLRIDPMLRAWPDAAKKMSDWGFACAAHPDARSIEEARRFLRHWIDKMGAIYLAVSLPPDFRYPAAANDPVTVAGQTILEKVVLPVCAERNLPFAMMIGSRLRVNPALGDAGDMVGKADIASLTNILAAFPNNRFLVTMLSRENQHELCVAARKFGNLMVFGCWWFTNNPSIITEMTRMRIELLGTSFIPQHSDARILDQLLYKWSHSRELIGNVLAEKLVDVARTGFHVTEQLVKQVSEQFFRGNFLNFLAG
jgi:hypothetical protein